MISYTAFNSRIEGTLQSGRHCHLHFTEEETEVKEGGQPDISVEFEPRI